MLSGQDEVDSAGLEGFRDLVRAAFERARAAGKDDWRSMTTAVLKNRLLDLTGRSFSERAYGAANLLELLRRIPDTVQVRGETHPLTVHLVPSDAAVEPGEVARSRTSHARPWEAKDTEWARWRVRDDLWRAVLDYDSGHPYVLNTTTGLAEPGAKGVSGGTVLPRASPDVLEQWRRTFVHDLPEPDKDVHGSRLAEWVTSSGATFVLPSSVRHLWNESLKRRVIDRLVSWYEERGDSVPDDLLVPARVIGRERPDATVERDLRDFILACVAVMSLRELEQLQIPATAAQRVRVHGPRV